MLSRLPIDSRAIKSENRNVSRTPTAKIRIQRGSCASIEETSDNLPLKSLERCFIARESLSCEENHLIERSRWELRGGWGMKKEREGEREKEKEKENNRTEARPTERENLRRRRSENLAFLSRW